MKKDVLVIITGGTIDAEVYPDPAHPPKRATMLEHSMIPEVVTHMGHGGRCDFLPWHPKDSNEFTAEEMRDLSRIIRTSPAKYVIITHGTDAMADHSREIAQYLQSPDPSLRGDHPSAATVPFVRGEGPVRDKVVAFTGAMTPLANGPESDAYKNLQYIFEQMEGWRPGVRVVMHGKSFATEGLQKNFTTYTFEGRQIPDAQREAGR